MTGNNNKFMCTVGSIVPNDASQLYTVRSTDSVATAIKLMTEKHILSVPVFDVEHRVFNRFLDMIDITTFCLDQLSDKLDNVDNILAVKDIFNNTKCGDICDASGRNPYRAVESRASLLNAVELMVKWNVHRLPVIDSEGNMVSILTQSRVIGYINDNLREIDPKLLRSTLSKMESLGTSEVIGVTEESAVLDAFKIMKEKKISAVAVIIEDGTIVGNISASDIKMIGPEGTFASRLQLTVRTFLNMIPKDPTENEHLSSVVQVQGSTTFEDLLEKYLLTKVHRVYMLDDNKRASRIISQGDVLKCIIDN
ncbi:hypothetical protein SAMD00019534_106830, partial [Acytostelium subglobosum LB1]|uniref:hypothetical protein n=1 Tax=Acytostelium subglobosum LB1 TaxID=1410327 RepID=UPI00064486C1